MSTEQKASLESRAAVHAALSDPARLAIVDALALSDVAPSELQDLLRMPSNLVAHHLKVLDAAGLISRVRSEGDRRRTYLTLIPSALAGVDAGASTTAARVVFVCTANSARSQLAAALWRRTSTIPAASAGTHPARHIDPGAVAVARRHGLPLRIRRPRALQDVVTADDLIVTVCDSAHEELSLGGVDGLHWSVRDPVPAGTDAAFDDAFTQLTRRVTDVADRIYAS